MAGSPGSAPTSPLHSKALFRGVAPPERPWRNFYGRLKGKTLRPSQLRDLDELLPQLSVGQVTWDENPERRPIALPSGAIWLEIGFGGGEHLVAQARANPDVTIIGCEPYLNGVAMLLGKIRQSGVTNVRVYPGDARDLLEVLPAGTLDRVFLLYPDPWPKARHHRRRFVTPEYLDPLALATAPGSTFRVATDIPDYVRQALLEVPRAGFTWTAERADDWRTPWADWTRTRYEAKALREGRRPHYLTFLREMDAPADAG